MHDSKYSWDIDFSHYLSTVCGTKIWVAIQRRWFIYLVTVKKKLNAANDFFFFKFTAVSWRIVSFFGRTVAISFNSFMKPVVALFECSHSNNSLKSGSHNYKRLLIDGNIGCFLWSFCYNFVSQSHTLCSYSFKSQCIAKQYMLLCLLCIWVH